MKKQFVAPLLFLFVSVIAHAETPAAFLTLYPDGHYTLPTGESVTVTGSRTGGVQEAINRAVKDNYDLFVSGGDFKNRVYSCSAPILFPPMQGKLIRFGACTVDFNGFDDRKAPAVVLDSCMNVTVESAAQFVYHLDGTVLRFEPRGLLPVDDFVGPTMVASRFSFMAVCQVNTPVSFVGKDGKIPREDLDAACVVIAPVQAINRCEFHFVELLGGNVGLRVDTPSEDGSFAFNRLSAMFAHEQFHTTIMEGTRDGAAENSRLRGNQWNVHCAPGAGAVAVDVHGILGAWSINNVAERGALSAGLLTHPTTTGNHFTLLSLDGEVRGPWTPATPGTNKFE